MKISRFIHKQDHFNFSFGKENIEPVVVIIHYLILSGFLIYALYDDITIIMSGGNKVQLGGVVVYLLFTTTLLIVFARKLRKMTKDSYSALISSELMQWEVSLKQSIFTLVSYLVSTVILFLSCDNILPFIDPIVLIFFIILTFTTVLRECF